MQSRCAIGNFSKNSKKKEGNSKSFAINQAPSCFEQLIYKMFKGKTFLIAGKLSITQVEMKNKLIENGGTVINSGNEEEVLKS